MKTHQQIDERSLAMARAIVSKIDLDPERRGLQKAREICARWYSARPEAAIAEWLRILENPWEVIQRLRQSDPFCGILTPRERWAIYREFSERK